MTPAIEFQDCMDDIGQEQGSIEQAVTAYGDGKDGSVTTTNDE